MSQESLVRGLLADRIGGEQFGRSNKIYKFEKIKRAKQEALAKNPDVKLIDLGVGEPDGMADDEVVKTLSQEAAKPENRFYADNGIAEFKQAASEYMQEVFGRNWIRSSYGN